MGDVLHQDSTAVASSEAAEIPTKDRNIALMLLLEFALQKGSLNEILDMVKLLLTIWKIGRERQDNRSGFVGPKVCNFLLKLLFIFFRGTQGITQNYEKKVQIIIENDT